MEQLNSLQEQARTLRTAFDASLDEGKTLEESKQIYLQLKAVEKMIHERKLILIKKGDA